MTLWTIFWVTVFLTNGNTLPPKSDNTEAVGEE